MLGLQVRTAVTRQIMHYDEAYYLLESLGVADILRALPVLAGGRATLANVKATLREKGDIIPPGNCKPTYALLLGLVSFLPIDRLYIGNFFGIGFALFGFFIFYRCAKEVGNAPVQALALAALLFVSPIWNYYAVSGFSNAIAGVLELTAVWLYLRGRTRAAALGLGIAFTVHYGLLPTTGLLLACMIYGQAQEKKPLKALQLAALFLLPILLWQTVYLIGRHFIQGQLSDVVYRTYFEQILYNFHRVSPQDQAALYGAALKRNFITLAGFIQAEGVLASLFLLGGCLGSWFIWPRLQRREKECLAVLTLTALAWLFNPGVVVSRAIAFLLPLLYLSVAFFAGRSSWAREIPVFARATVFGILLSVSFVRTWNMDSLLRTPYQAAADYLKSQGYAGQIVDPEQWPVWQVHMQTRMNGRPERVSDRAQLQSFITEAAAASPNGKAPLMIIDGAPMIARDAEIQNFLAPVYARIPDWQAAMPYTELPVHRHEISSLNEKRGPGSGALMLYWLPEVGS